MNIGDKVYFQFDDEGVIREAGGILKEIDSLGWYICEFLGSNCTVKCLPYSVRPIQFSQVRLRDKIKTYGDAKVAKENSVREYPLDIEATESEFRKVRQNLYDYIRWIK